MSLYERLVLSPMLDRICGVPEVMALRRELLPEASGHVIELGFGSGLNLALYDADRVDSVTGVDPGVHITALAEQRIADSPIPVELLSLSGEAVPSDDRRFDTAVVTFTFCTIPNVYRALAEVRRLLRPGGRLLVLEHGLAPEPSVAAWQRRIEPLWKRMAGGCHLTRDTRRLVEDAGFRFETVEQGFAMPGPRIMTWVTRGIARPR